MYNHPIMQKPPPSSVKKATMHASHITEVHQGYNTWFSSYRSMTLL